MHAEKWHICLIVQQIKLQIVERSLSLHGKDYSGRIYKIKRYTNLLGS